jgi:hypothetical protein
MKMPTPFKKCHPERSENMREADVLAESKDPGEVGGIRGTSGNSHRAQRARRTPCNMADNPYRGGVIRLRSRFASRTSRSAQNDSFKRVTSSERSEGPVVFTIAMQASASRSERTA